VHIAGGGQNSLALKSDGSVAVWGRNEYGECNVPDNTAGLKVQDFRLGNDFVDIAGGYNHILTVVSKICSEEIPGDTNNDCKVDFADFAAFAGSWLECNLDPREACWE
jgi:hypothetical protein